MALAQFDRGAAPVSLPMERMQLVLTRSSQQTSALKALLDAQQDRSSTSYHKWLTPEQFGEQFGPADQDVQAVVAWLQVRGFQVNQVANGKTSIEFSGNAGQVRESFHTEIHKFAVNGEEHWANASDPQIPAALAPVVGGVATLHNFHSKSMARISPKWRKGGGRPGYNEGGNDRALSPADYAVIYNINPLYKAGINGTGVVIGALGRALVATQDVADFRKAVDLPKNPPQIVVSGTSPDYWQENLDDFVPDPDIVEGTLDVTWSGAIAPNATVKFIIAADTDTSDGVALAELYAVDNNLADILTESFGNCESEVTAAQAQQISAIREQAAAQGITYVVSTGDWGPYTCFGQVSSGIGPVSVNMLASSPYAVAVGGTEFDPSTNTLTYWSSTNNAKTLASALSYIPETVWNDSCDAAKCGADSVSVEASGGGASKLFKKPSWQSGVPGIPNDGARDIPDVSLTASPDTDPYLICFEASCEGGPITADSFMPIGGTSASAPSFAGIMALVNQKMKSRQGLVNYVLYRLAAAQQYPKCDGSNLKTLPESTCTFNDITAGNDAIPGEPKYGETGAQYQAGAGYDLTTGRESRQQLGFGDLQRDEHEPDAQPHGGKSWHAGQRSIVGGAPERKRDSERSGIARNRWRSGLRIFSTDKWSRQLYFGFIARRNYNVEARYSGDDQFAPSESSAVSVTVAPEPSTTTAGALFFLFIPNAFYTSGTYGNASLYLSAQVAGLSGQGTPTGKVTFTDNGAPISGGTGAVNTESKALSTNSAIVFTPGQHSIVAAYQGDASFEPSVSPPVILTIAKAQTTLSIQPNITQAPAGQTVSLTATIESGNGQYGNFETGTVTYFLNGAFLVKRPVIPGFDFGTELLVGNALFNSSTLPEGTDTITATYSGDSNYLGSSARPVVVNVGTKAPACRVTNFTADPNPITVFDPPAVTLINVAAACAFDVRVGSPGGTLLGSGKGNFFGTTTAPVTNGTTFYLQSQGNMTAQGTLQTLTVGVESGVPPCVVYSFSATPSPIISTTGLGATTITAVASCNFDVRTESPGGKLLGSTSENVLISPTGNWVRNGMEFFLQQHGNTKASGTLATLTVPVVAPAAQ